MEKNTFYFKKFKVEQGQCAMKIGTDSILLGALVNSNSPKRILDIGTGTGVLSLMMAQKYRIASIDAVEINPQCAQQAKENVAACPWANRISIHAQAIQEFIQEENYSYDLILSNPPYFIGSQSPEKQRSQARNQESLSLRILLESVRKRLDQTGEFWVILPYDQGQILLEYAIEFHLFPRKEIAIKSIKGGKVIRTVWCFTFNPSAFQKRELSIYDDESKYSSEYKKMTEAFYLFFPEKK